MKEFQEKILLEDPVLGKQYKAYMTRVPYRIVPYIW
jgi:protein-S-isoprenylcysteine O-methyltransferase Ste14